MADTRSLREKLQAMANQTASPHEAAVARSLLENLEANRANSKTPGLLSRDDILAAPDRKGPAVNATVTVRYRGTVFTLSEDEAVLIFGSDYQRLPGLVVLARKG